MTTGKAEGTRMSYDGMSDEEFWDARYGGSHQRVWSGDPNVALVAEGSDLEPGRALDLGCGEGGDAIWLARRGWRVTAVDISGVVLERAARSAEEAGVAGRIDWQRHDLGVSFPEGEFDLVSAHFLHSPGAGMPREKILRAAASAVAPGGVLLIVGHAGPPPWDPDGYPEVHLPTPQEVLEGLALPRDGWRVLRCEEYEREQAGPEGRPFTRTDNVLKVRRLDG
ncbi:SAM-dependent methyltransferase [Planomonospora corallina]|uniref:SAM-dependent methyltransferase n=1 Tax=Planomonospora corallina TaxID=1806052 RepID=A0ABV8IBC8_9ACTN